MKFADYHIHSNHSCDGKSSIFEICQKAIELRIEEIGFSEHMDFEPGDWGYGFFNYDRYTSEIESSRRFFKNKLAIRKGIEIDYQPCFEAEIKDWVRNKKFDFTIGSVHYLDHEIISHKLLRSKDLKKIYHIYFDEVTNSIESHLFDVIGHFDLVSGFLDDRKSELKSFNYRGSVKAILAEIVRNKMYLEVNSRGLRETCKDTMPSKEIVRDFIEQGGNLISIGSDAHLVQEIGSGIKEILDFLENYNLSKIKLLFG